MNETIISSAETSNPIIDTARLTISQLAVAGVPEAAEEGTITDIRIDASGLDYISSAGLRTLLIMQKNLKDNKIHFDGAQKVVLEILEQTGFSDLLDVEKK